MDATPSKEAAADPSRPVSEASQHPRERENMDHPPPQASENLADSLGFGSWPHSDEALVQALRTKAEHERTRQEYYRSESTKRVLQILDMAARLQIPGASLPLLFTGNDELAFQVIAQANSANTADRQPSAQLSQQQQQQQPQQQPQHQIQQQPQQQQQQQQQQQLSPIPAHMLSHKSPRTPVRTSALTSPVDLGSPAPFLPSGPVSQYTTPQQAITVHQAQQSQSVPSHFQPPPQQQQHQQQQRHQPHLSFDSTQDSIGDRSAKKHRHAVSALTPTTIHGPLSPPAYPGPQNAQGRPVVSGFYPPQLIPPRLPNLQHLSSPLPQQPHQQPQQQQQQQQQQPQQQQPQQQQHQHGQIPQGFAAVPVPAMPAPLTTSTPSGIPQQIPGSIPGAMPGSLPLQMVQQPPLSPSHALSSTPSRNRQSAHAPSMSIDSSASFSHEPRAGTKRGLTSDTPNSKHAAGWTKGHRQSLSTGADLQIHQWKPKQLLRDNRWKITNPFSRTKGSKINADSKDASQTASTQRSQGARTPESSARNPPSSTTSAPQPPQPSDQSPSHTPSQSSASSHGTATKRPSPENSTSNSGHPAIKVEESTAGQNVPSRPPSRGAEQSTAAVVAAHNNKRRSMTHARRRSAASYPVDTASLDDANRRDEGVAVLASLASEQWRRDRENPPSAGTPSAAPTQPPSRTGSHENPAGTPTSAHPQS